jgi:FAD/FMN-containing dehydrogenase
METRTVADIGERAIQDFRSALRGELIRPGDEGYDAARTLHNRMVDRRPGLIVRCAGVADVMSAVDFARQNRLLLAVRGSGHHVTGNALCDDGVVIDLSRLKGLRIDPVARTARAEPGLTWGELNHDLQAFGLGATGGYISITGIPGLTLGGGLGWLVRKHGLALDNLLSLDVVTADGHLVTASAAEHGNLFWGMRGAGANFGVATSFEFRVHPVGTVLAGPIIYPLAEASALLRTFRQHVETAPEELTWGVLFLTIPASPEFPPPLHDAPVAVLAICYAGSIAEGEAFLRPIRETGRPLADLVQPTPYALVQKSADFAWPPGYRNYWKSCYLRNLDDTAIDVITDSFARVPSPRTVVVLDHNGGGAISRVAPDATAFGHRNWTYNMVITSAWSAPADDEPNIGWTREFWQMMQPHAAEAVYVNYTSDQDGETLNKVYLPSTRARLAALKSKYDPTNLFRMNHNIEPAAAGV